MCIKCWFFQQFQKKHSVLVASGGVLWDSQRFLLLPCLYLIILLCTLQEESGKCADVFGKTPSQNKKTPSRMCIEHASAVLKRGIDTEPQYMTLSILHSVTCVISAVNQMFVVPHPYSAFVGVKKPCYSHERQGSNVLYVNKLSTGDSVSYYSFSKSNKVVVVNEKQKMEKLLKKRPNTLLNTASFAEIKCFGAASVTKS